MHYVMVEGYPLPAPFGGHPALELCNTWSGWQDPPDVDGPVDRRREYLADPDRLAVWLVHHELVDRDDGVALREWFVAHPTDGAAALADVRRLRSLAYPLLLDPAAATWPAVATYADDAAAASRLERDGSTFVRRGRGADVGRPVRAVAGAVEQLLTGPDRTAVRACPGTDCGWLFLDRNGRRKWCSMTSCGNRAKVRAYEERRHPGP
jgi:predicted RNA-binding Zn ribbon-like protein